LLFEKRAMMESISDCGGFNNAIFSFY